jgi:hypothetical protein
LYISPIHTLYTFLSLTYLAYILALSRLESTIIN